MSTRLSLPESTRRAFDRMAGDLVRIFDRRFVGLVASGPHSGVAFVLSVTPGDLEALGPAAHAWHRDRLETPLFLTPHEFRRSLDAFPVEYQALLDRHVVIAGLAPFDGLSIDPGNLRRACEVQAKSHLLHLRQDWIGAAGHDEDLVDLLIRSAEPLRALLADVARLDGARGGDDVALEGARIAGLDVELAGAILALEAAPDHAHRLLPRLPDYLVLAEQLWAFVDAWTS